MNTKTAEEGIPGCIKLFAENATTQSASIKKTDRAIYVECILTGCLTKQQTTKRRS